MIIHFLCQFYGNDIARLLPFLAFTIVPDPDVVVKHLKAAGLLKVVAVTPRPDADTPHTDYEYETLAGSFNVKREFDDPSVLTH